jgi:chloramphenicol 3-O-phosphotransferase
MIAKKIGKYDAKSYAIIDGDHHTKMLPAAYTNTNIPTVDGRPSGVHYSQMWSEYVAQMRAVEEDLCHHTTERRYNVVLQTHSVLFDCTRYALHNYHISIVYVSVPLELAQRRACKRAVETGIFLSNDLQAQDELITWYNHFYKSYATLYAQFAYQFVVVDNSGAKGAPKIKTLIKRSDDWAIPGYAECRALADQ